MPNNPLKDLVVRATIEGSIKSNVAAARKLSATTYAALKGAPEVVRKNLSGMNRVIETYHNEVGTWVEPEKLNGEQPSPFDACDLRHWLSIAEQAGVPTVPAKTIISLTEDEFSLVSGEVHVPDFARHAIKRKIESSGILDERSSEDVSSQKDETEERRTEVVERLFDAMDDVPADWMVRSNLSASSLLKGMVGTGEVNTGGEFYDVDENIRLGPGYISFGNRRTVDTKDERIVSTFAKGHKEEIHFLARPWVPASRYVEAEDPHRHGSVFAGKGTWPCEWRVFIENGKVTGVSSYYTWIGERTPENAYHALEAAEAAQRIVDKAVELDAQPRMMDLEFIRQHKSEDAQAISDRFPRDGVHCTLDFIETEDGPMLLEGGPPHTPVGGAFPCAFAGNGVRKETGLCCDTKGVALKQMDHVHLAEPDTWFKQGSADTILSWEEARELAAQYEPDVPPTPGP